MFQPSSKGTSCIRGLRCESGPWDAPRNRSWSPRLACMAIRGQTERRGHRDRWPQMRDKTTHRITSLRGLHSETGPWDAARNRSWSLRLACMAIRGHTGHSDERLRCSSQAPKGPPAYVGSAVKPGHGMRRETAAGRRGWHAWHFEGTPLRAGTVMKRFVVAAKLQRISCKLG